MSDNKTLFMPILLIVVCLGAIIYLFSGSFVELEHTWSTKEEYSHGYMIPVVALFLFWQKLPSVMAITWQPARLAPLVLLAALFGWALGEITGCLWLARLQANLGVFCLPFIHDSPAAFSLPEVIRRITAYFHYDWRSGN